MLINQIGWRSTYLLLAVVASILVLPWTLFVFKLHPEDIGWKPYGWTEEDERRELDVIIGAVSVEGVSE